MPMMATCSGTAIPEIRHTCNTWRARASVTAMMPTGLGKLSIHDVNCALAWLQTGALVGRPR